MDLMQISADANVKFTSLCILLIHRLLNIIMHISVIRLPGRRPDNLFLSCRLPSTAGSRHTVPY